MGFINLEEEEEKALREGRKLKTSNTFNNSEMEIERTYLVKDKNLVKKFGKFKHYTENYIYKDPKGYLRLTDKYINKTDPLHMYKATLKENYSGLKRKENVWIMTEDQFEGFKRNHESDLVGIAHNTIYGMPDGSVVLIREFPNGKTIITGEKEFESEKESRNFELPPWAVKEVTDDPKYRGNQMAMDNFKK